MNARRRSARAVPAIDPRFARYRLHVRRSPIQGWGVYASESIPAGRLVIEYTGERLSRAATLRRLIPVWGPGGNGRLYLARVNSYWAIDGSRGGSGAERVNHSCEPNLKMRKIRGRLFFFSRKWVPKGAELTLDYRFRKEADPVACHCGARTCRGTINLR
jgi:uncharacterized protein